MAGLTIEEAVNLANLALIDSGVGPEKVRAFAPDAVPVDWEMKPLDSRINKMSHVRNVVVHEVPMHQIPQVILLAEDGAAVTLLGWDHGMASTEAAARALALVAAG